MLRDYPITTFCAAPTVYRMLINLDVNSIKTMALDHVLSAAEPLVSSDSWKLLDFSVSTLAITLASSNIYQQALQAMSFPRMKPISPWRLMYYAVNHEACRCSCKGSQENHSFLFCLIAIHRILRLLTYGKDYLASLSEKAMVRQRR